MRDNPIGIFDSGLGGLTTVKEISKLMPNENIIYFGDTARAPYGNKEKKTIIKYRKQAANFLVSNNVKFIVAACGTVSSVSDNIKIIKNTPFQGVITPTCETAVKASKNGRIGVIGTTTTIKSKSYLNKILSINPKIMVIQQDCPMFASLIEKGIFTESNKSLVNYANQYLSPFKSSDIDTLILGCTHYPIITDIIKMILGDNIKLIDSGKETAKFIYKKMNDKNLVSHNNKKGKYRFFISSGIYNFSKIANIFLEKNITSNIEIVDINKY